MQTRSGKRTAFFIVSLMLSACGGGGGSLPSSTSVETYSGAYGAVQSPAP